MEKTEPTPLKAFQLGSYYRHTSGIMMSIVARCTEHNGLIAESFSPEYGLAPRFVSEAATANWVEATENEWRELVRAGVRDRFERPKAADSEWIPLPEIFTKS